MMKRETIPIADVYVPIKRRATLEQKRVDEIAASILDKGLLSPILVRADGARFVLVEGLHRLEAAKALGEKTIIGFLASSIGARLDTEHPAARFSLTVAFFVLHQAILVLTRRVLMAQPEPWFNMHLAIAAAVNAVLGSFLYIALDRLRRNS